MPLKMLSNPHICLAADIGSSSSKFFYQVKNSQILPLWMGSEVAPNLSQVSLPHLKVSARPQDGAWLQIGDDYALVGDAAKTRLESNSLSANKAGYAAYKLMAALGVVAELEHLPSHYDATVWLALPLTEMGTRQQVKADLLRLCQQGFSFRGRSQQVNVSFKSFPEGFGLYLNRKQQLETMGQSITQRRTLVVMMGHRNLSVLCFERGSLKIELSNSDGPGFWPVFEKSARSLGVTAVDQGALLHALMTGNPQQISPARGCRFDFSEYMAACRQDYWQAVKMYWEDHVSPHLASNLVDVVISGGASQVLRPVLEQYFEELGLSQLVYFADGQYERLRSLVETLPEAAMDTAMTLRMTDCYGLFRGLLGTLSKVAV
jgi:hypothetical protein